MKALVVFDTVQGNTRQIAEAVGRGIGKDVRVVPAGELSAAALAGVELLVVGSPTMGGRPTKPITDALDRIPAASLAGVHVAGFDTRLGMKFVKIFGYAAAKIAAVLEAKGGKVIVTPGGFLVKGREGPLADGELERAASWGRSLAAR
jgi:flavodoxin